MIPLRLFLLLVLPLSFVGMFAKDEDKWRNLYELYGDDEMPYRLMRPLGFDSSKRYPLIVSLHGGMEEERTTGNN